MALFGVSTEQAMNIARSEITAYIQGGGSNELVAKLCQQYGVKETSVAIEKLMADIFTRIQAQLEAYKENALRTAKGTIDERTSELVRGLDLEALVREKTTEALANMRPAVYTERPDEKLYGLIREASFDSGIISRRISNKKQEDAERDVKTAAAKTAEELALKAGTALGAEIMVVLKTDARITKDRKYIYDSNYDYEAEARLNVAFYRRRESGFSETR